MRRSATEIIRNLEQRVARLEKQSSLIYPQVHGVHGVGDISDLKNKEYFKNKLTETMPDVEWDVSNVEVKKNSPSWELEIEGKFKTKQLIDVHYDGKEVPSILEEGQPFKNCWFENYTRIHSDSGRGEIYPNKGLSLTEMIEVEYDDRDSKWVVISKDRRFNFELETTFNPKDDASALVREINKRLR